MRTSRRLFRIVRTRVVRLFGRMLLGGGVLPVLAIVFGCDAGKTTGPERSLVDKDTIPVTTPLDTLTVDLKIPDRPWDPNRPDKSVGWCAEACIQMAMAYLGRELSQKAINDSAHAVHPDMYMDDIDVALTSLNVRAEKWPEVNRDLDEYFAWVRANVAQGRPVICGVKIYPDEEPTWFLDHFVLVVGFRPDALLVNTNMDEGQMWISRSQLSSQNAGLSFANKYTHYYARAITGIE